MKKSVVILLVVSLFPAVLFAGGQQGGSQAKPAVSGDAAQKEAPMLAAKAAAGQLPPLAQRLPAAGM